MSRRQKLSYITGSAVKFFIKFVMKAASKSLMIQEKPTPGNLVFYEKIFRLLIKQKLTDPK